MKLLAKHLYYVLKNKLYYQFLKTMTKSNKLFSNSSKIKSFIFIKIIIQALSLKMKIIFVDESNFQLENSHLKVWRKRNEKISYLQ